MGAVGIGEAVGLVPLDVADPQGGFRQLRRVLVDLQAHHLVGLHRGRQAMPAPGRGEVDDLPFQIQQRAQGDVEEVAAAAGRVQHGYGGETAAEGFQPRPRQIVRSRIYRIFGLTGLGGHNPVNPVIPKILLLTIPRRAGIAARNPANP